MEYESTAKNGKSGICSQSKMIKVKWNKFWGTDENEKWNKFSGTEGGSNFFFLIKWILFSINNKLMFIF